MEKICNRCGIMKPFTEFHKHRSHRDGHTTICKSCMKIKMKKDYSKIKIKHDEWIKNHPEHKEYTKAYNKQYRENPENKERNKEYQKKYAKTEKGHAVLLIRTHRRRKRSRLLINDLTYEQLIEIRESQNNTCPNCNKPFTTSRPYELDHIIPVSKSKSGDPGLTRGNVQLLCKSCNAKKNNKYDTHPTTSKG